VAEVGSATPSAVVSTAAAVTKVEGMEAPCSKEYDLGSLTVRAAEARE
jgi:hypothetical protein